MQNPEERALLAEKVASALRHTSRRDIWDIGMAVAAGSRDMSSAKII